MVTTLAAGVGPVDQRSTPTLASAGTDHPRRRQDVSARRLRRRGVPDGHRRTGATRPHWRSRRGLFQRVTDVGGRLPAGRSTRGSPSGATPPSTPRPMRPATSPPSTKNCRRRARKLRPAADGAFQPTPLFLSADIDAVRRSIRTFANDMPDFENGLVGHGEPVAGGRRVGSSARLGQLSGDRPGLEQSGVEDQVSLAAREVRE